MFGILCALNFEVSDNADGTGQSFAAFKLSR
ncbi:hypothetical protein HMPREF1022_01011 [Desulfovibrio sp. 6_1_46AFAA]|nr:hypothetical protein HMPREF1022_01011 [Desulfovibrio sp. 6_1_46AFAA]